MKVRYFLSEQKEQKGTENPALSEIETQISESGRSVFNEISFENFSYYLGFDKL